MEQIHGVIYAIVSLHFKPETGGSLPPATLEHIGQFTGYVSHDRDTLEFMKLPQDPPQAIYICYRATGDQQNQILLPPERDEHIA